MFAPNPVPVSGQIAATGGPISIPFSFTSTGDFATTTSVTVNNGGGVVTSNGFTTSGSYTFNGGQANIGNVTFNAATDTYTASGMITGTLTAGQTLTGSFTLPVTTLETGLGDTYAPIVINFTAAATAPVALPAVADTSNQSGVFAPMISKGFNPGASYAGFSTMVTGGNGAINPINGSMGGPIEHTTATMLAGVNTGANPIAATMAWRTHILSETPGSQAGMPISPPLPAVSRPLVSDVLQLTLTDALIGSTPSSPYALEMNYDATLVGDMNQQNMSVQQKLLFLAWLNPNGTSPGVAGWVNSVQGNTGNNATAAEEGFLGSFAAFQTANGTNLSSYVGAWGVDTTNDEAWAVLNHSSTFAVLGPLSPVVPEPSTLALAACGLLGLWGAGRRALKNARARG